MIVRRSTRWAALAVATAALLSLTACQSSSTGTSTGLKAKDDGAQLTLWVRNTQAPQADALVKLYNKTHKNQIKITETPYAALVTKIAAAASSGDLPDLLVNDDVLSPQFASTGIFTNITDAYHALPHSSSIAPGMVKVATVKGKVYELPFDLDPSVMFYNKDLFKKAGLNPDNPPKTFAAVAADARKISKLGGGVSGFYEAAACGGCMAFTSWPIIWASGGTVMNAAGTQSSLDSATAKKVYSIYNGMFKDGTIPASAVPDNGANWLKGFTAGDVGITFLNAGALGGLLNAPFKVGLAPIPGLTAGGESTFTGGDNIGITRDAKHAAEALDFVSWLQGDTAQVEALAKNGFAIARSDLANNKYAKSDPREVTVNQIVAKGQVPFTPRWSQVYADANGPWQSLITNVLIKSDPSSSLDTGVKQLNTALTATQ